MIISKYRLMLEIQRILPYLITSKKIGFLRFKTINLSLLSLIDNYIEIL